ncbi:glycosyltransferase family 39 protein [Dactylosporangium sp. NPDC000555]|uniref:glycosyltransferase family 39 protein n=1 Tax=Dactylosporangium sp. NPDC000555 TaxID=3154260 RepID=UPI003320BE50
MVMLDRMRGASAELWSRAGPAGGVPRWVYRAGLGAILLVAFAVRFYRLGAVPSGLNRDEASAGYEAYSLLHHGTDRWGNHLPVYFPAFGSGMNVLLSYLEIPFIKVFGLSVLSLRLLPAALGVLSVYLLYLLVHRIADRTTGLVASALLAVLPWHVMATRWSLESNVLPFFVLAGVLTMVCCYGAADRRRWALPVSLLPLAISLYAYGIAAVVVVGIIVLFALANWRVIRAHKVGFGLSLAGFGVLALPFGLFLLVNNVLHRAPHWLSALPFSVPLLTVTRLDEVSADGTLIGNVRFVASGFDDGLIWNVLPGWLPLGPVVVPLAAVGCYYAVRRRGMLLAPLCWLLACLPLFLVAPLNVNRANALYLPLVALSAVGLVEVGRSLREARGGRAIPAVLLSLALVYNALFCLDYFKSEERLTRAAFSDGVDHAIQQAHTAAAGTEPIFVSEIPLNYMYVLFTLQTDAVDFQQHAEIHVQGTGYYVRNYRNFYFHAGDPALAAGPTYVTVLQTFEQPPCPSPQDLYRTQLWKVQRCTKA